MDQYDEVGTIASLRDRCTFCKLVYQDEEKNSNQAEGKSGPVLFRDEHCVIFADKRKDRVTEHYQCVPKRHIRDFTQLRLELEDSKDAQNEESGQKTADMSLLEHMAQVGLRFLQERHSDKVAQKQFRIGFHAPGHNSQDHLHLHLIITPILGNQRTHKKYARKYGTGLTPVKEVIKNQHKYILAANSNRV